MYVNISFFDNMRQAFDGLSEKMNQLARDLVEYRNKLLFSNASRQGHRYWTDTHGTIRRMPGTKPLLHRGKKAR